MTYEIKVRVVASNVDGVKVEVVSPIRILTDPMMIEVADMIIESVCDTVDDITIIPSFKQFCDAILGARVDGDTVLNRTKGYESWWNYNIHDKIKKSYRKMVMKLTK